ncbi:histone-lysine N-methyltransferase SETMAR [Trichonephila clavipes]|nr:histone-lysine N-methyltransferase SETMAR [Trichonephila clavipes]
MTKPCRRPLRTVVEDVNLPDNSRLHLYRLDKTYSLSKWVPHALLEVHKQQRVAACLSLLSRHRSASLFNRVLTSDKWGLYDTPNRPNIGGHLRKLSRTSQDHLYTHARLCFVSGGLVVKWFTMSCYQQAKRSPRGCIHSNWNQLGWETLCHLPCPPDLAPSDYHLFHSLYLRGKSFTNEADVRQALTDFFASHTPEFCCKGMEQLETRWQKVLDADGDYFKD